jgi:hypothetical protein
MVSTESLAVPGVIPQTRNRPAPVGSRVREEE